jgi:HNH endonuclease
MSPEPSPTFQQLLERPREVSSMTVDHLCRIRCCWNPDHLEAVTRKENVMRGTGICALNIQKMHCPRGHLYDEKDYKPNGSRQCRKCERENRQRRSKELGLIPPAMRTHCPHGHPYDEANTYIKSDGSRACRECRRISERKRG